MGQPRSSSGVIVAVRSRSGEGQTIANHAFDCVGHAACA